MRKRLNLLGVMSFCLVGGWLGVVPSEAGEVAYARQLAISPDGQTLAFSWAGDVWTVPLTGGNARRLTVHPRQDGYPVWSPDGQRLAIGSERHGACNVFVMRPDGTELRRLTFSDRDEVPTSFSADGAWIHFHSEREGELDRRPRMYRVPVDGGQSWRVLDCFGEEAQVAPGGERIVFSRGSSRTWRRLQRSSAAYDVWLWDGGQAAFRQLTDFAGHDFAPQWGADGTYVYFLSDRGGAMNIWRVPLAGGPPEAVTDFAGDAVRAFDVSPDGETLVFARWDRLYVMQGEVGRARELDITAGGDLPRNDVQLQRYTRGADEAEPSPDGDEIALVVHGEILVIKTEEDRPTRQVTDSAARDHDVTWSPDGKALFFVSDMDGQEDVYRATSAEEPAKALSDSLRFKIERVTDSPELEYGAQVSPDGKQLAYIRGLGTLIIRDLETGEERVLVDSWNRPGYRWSPDSEWLAYALEDTEHNSDVWVVPADGRAAAVNVSQHPDYDGNPQWSADGEMLAFASRRHGFDTDLYVVFLSEEMHEKSAVEFDEYFEEREKAVKKRKPLKEAVASGEIVLAGAVVETQPAEPGVDEASEATDTAPAEDAPSTQPVETQPTTAPADEEDELAARVRELVREILAAERAGEKKEKDDKDEEKAEEDEAEDVEEEDTYELETCWQRIRRVTSLEGNQSNFVFSPTGQTLIFTSSHEGSGRTYSIQWDGSERKQILGSGAGALRWSLDGKRIYYASGGVPRSCSPSGSSRKTHEFRAKLAISWREEAAQKFADGARRLGMRFYHPTMKGLDWPALTERYRELAIRTHTVPEFNSVFNRLLGELNASHMGIYGPSQGGTERVGYLGCRFDKAYPGPGLKVLEVLRDSPADRAESRLVPGDVILRVDGRPVGPESPIEEALIDSVGDEVVLEYEPSPDREGAVAEEMGETQPATETAPAAQAAGDAVDVTAEVVIRPTSSGAISGLQYKEWVRRNREYVEEKSKGRIGYTHIRSMNESSFEVFERDLYAAANGRDGLIIDVRSNGGGWTADWVLAVLNVRRHAYTIQRGAEPGYPQDRLIFYAWTKPATMMCNEQSFSNAEIVSHAFKNLERGPLVGMTSPGGVISTGGYRLIDGALVRMPMRGWYTLPSGTDMENNGAEPDVKVVVRPAHEVAGEFPQLDAAIVATLQQLEEPAGPMTIPTADEIE